MKISEVRYIIVLGLCLSLASASMAQKEYAIPAFDRFWRSEYQIIEGILNVYYTQEQVFLEIPENMLEREFCIAAQADRGFGWRNRYLKSIGVVKIRKGPGNTLCFHKGLFQERLRGAKGLQAAFDVSNRQPFGLIYPVVAFRKETSAYIIDITKAVKNGDDWFRCSAEELKGLHPAETEVQKIVALKDGLCFTIKREYGTDSPLRSGLPLEISCVVRLLPSAPVAVRYADPEFPYTSLTFTDYGKMPYGAVCDSLICRWRLTASQPVICYIDSLCPPEFVAYIRKGVQAWEKAFTEIGLRHVLQVQLADPTVNLAAERWVISYDLGKAGLERSWIIHPETGEIVYARLNIGHGVLLPALTEYWWECGTSDKRIRQNRMHPGVAGEILQHMVSREVGRLLGLLPRKDEPGLEGSILKNLFCNGRMSEISDEDCRQLAWGYRSVSGDRGVKANPRRGEEKTIGQLILLQKNIGNRKTMFRHLKEEIEQKGGNPGSYKDLYRTGLRYYCRDLESLTKLLNPATFSGITACLDSCLWHKLPECLDVAELRREGRLKNEEVVRGICRSVFGVMMQPDLLDSLKEKKVDLLQELHSKIWEDFDNHFFPSAYRMEIQRNFLNVFSEMKDRHKIEECRDDFSVFWWNEWNFLCDKFKEMSRNHGLQEGRDYYQLLCRRINKVI